MIKVFRNCCFKARAIERITSSPLINSITAAGIIGFDPNLMLETKVKMTENTESHSWEELVAEAEKNGFIETQIEDVLTSEEIKKADVRYQEIQREFSQRTKLDKLDIAFMFLDETKYQSAELYEVKTRKIILLSNTIATTSNAIYVALSKDYKKLDAGGMLVTLYRLISDKKFISKVKEEFINTKLDEDLQTELDEIDKTLAGIV